MYYDKLTRNGNESIKEYFPDCLNKKSENNSSYADSINLNYKIKIFPYRNGVIRYNLKPTVINDASFFYYESKKLFSKGQLFQRRVKCKKLSFESKQFINSRNEYHEAACTKLYKIVNWTFYEEGGNLLLECSYIKYRKITIPNGKWKYYKNNNVYKIEKYKKGELELVSFDSKDF